MTPDIKTYTSSEFTEYVESKSNGYDRTPLKGTSAEVHDLVDYIDTAEHDVHVHVRTDGTRAGTVLGFVAVLRTARDVQVIVTRFGARVISNMVPADQVDGVDDPDAAKIEVMFD